MARRPRDAGCYPVTGCRPWSTRAMNTMTATASRMWIRPPIVYELTIPNSHKTTRTVKTVESMLTSCHGVAPGKGAKLIRCAFHAPIVGVGGQSVCSVLNTRATCEG